MKKFNSVSEVKAFAAEQGPNVVRIEPHHSSSYLWRVWHPASFGARMTYGFSSKEALLEWANSSL
jgi:hypothetical protein